MAFATPSEGRLKVADPAVGQFSFRSVVLTESFFRDQSGLVIVSVYFEHLDAWKGVVTGPVPTSWTPDWS